MTEQTVNILVDSTNPEVSFFPMYVNVVRIPTDEFLIDECSKFGTLVPILETLPKQYKTQMTKTSTLIINDTNDFLTKLIRFITDDVKAIPNYDKVMAELQEINDNDPEALFEYRKMVLMHYVLAQIFECKAIWISFN